MHMLSRRAWLGATFAAGSALALSELPDAQAVEQLPRKSASRMRLSLAAYSFRNYFKDIEHKPDAKIPDDAKKIDMFDFIDYCAERQCDGAELTSYYFPPKADGAYLLQLKRHAFLRGVEISGSAVGNTFTHPEGDAREKETALVKKWIDNCQILGAPHLRVFAGAKRKEDTHDQAVEICVSALRECCAYAAGRGVFLGIENHGGIVEEPGPLLDILKTVNSPWLGINLDSANFHTTDPYGDFAKCAPYAVNVQIKTEVRPKGAAKSVRSDLKRYLEILRAANYQGYVALEFEEKADPYKAVPGVLDELRQLMRA